MINYHFCFVNKRTPLNQFSKVWSINSRTEHPIAGKGAVIELREIGQKYSVVE